MSFESFDEQAAWELAMDAAFPGHEQYGIEEMTEQQRSGLGDDAWRALKHIERRTRSDGFAALPWDMDERAWDRALAELRDEGYPIRWVSGTVADDPTIRGGWVLREERDDKGSKEDEVHNVVIVETDERVARERAGQLMMDGHQVQVAGTVQRAREMLAEGPDALVLCQAGGGPETIGLLRELRAGQIPGAEARLPVLVVGADDSAAVRYYRAGADVALPSASSPLLVSAGLESLERRSESQAQRPRVLRVGNVSVDCYARTVQVDGRAVKLTRLQFDLLQTMASQPRKTFSRAELTREVWGYEPAAAGPSRTVDTHVARARQKLEQAGAGPLMQNVHGVGWRLTR